MFPQNRRRLRKREGWLPLKVGRVLVQSDCKKILLLLLIGPETADMPSLSFFSFFKARSSFSRKLAYEPSWANEKQEHYISYTSLDKKLRRVKRKQTSISQSVLLRSKVVYCAGGRKFFQSPENNPLNQTISCREASRRFPHLLLRKGSQCFPIGTNTVKGIILAAETHFPGQALKLRDRTFKDQMHQEESAATSSNLK